MGPSARGPGSPNGADRGGGLVAALAIAVWLFGLGLTPDRYLPVLLVPALIIRRARRFALDFIPFAALLVITRSLAESLISCVLIPTICRS